MRTVFCYYMRDDEFIRDFALNSADYAMRSYYLHNAHAPKRDHALLKAQLADIEKRIPGLSHRPSKLLRILIDLETFEERFTKLANFSARMLTP